LLASTTSAVPVVWPHWLRAARQHRHAQLACDLERDGDIGIALGHEHADRHDLVDRCVGRVAAARRGIEANLAFGLGTQASGEVVG